MDEHNCVDEEEYVEDEEEYWHLEEENGNKAEFVVKAFDVEELASMYVLSLANSLT
jgi:hypothetical protein